MAGGGEHTALVAGSTGLIGRHVLRQLVSSADYSTVYGLVRAGSSALQEGVEVVETDFEAMVEGADLPRADHAYICLGTTIKKAGSKENFSRVDFDYAVAFAQRAQTAGARRLAVVSSVGARADTRNFYLRVKGQMEDAISQVPFERISIMRPSLLIGERPGDKRLAEGISQVLAPLFDPLLRGSRAPYHSIRGETVAKAMIAATLKGEPGTETFDYDGIMSWSDRLA